MAQPNLTQIKADLAAVIPDGWRTRVTTRQNGWVVLTIYAAPVDLMAMEAKAHPSRAGAQFCKVNPLPYEQPWDEPSAVIGVLWRILCRAKFRELWIGKPDKPFAVQRK